MDHRADPVADAADSPGESLGLNQVRLRGRVTQDATVRDLPSGATVVGFRVVVSRSATVMTKGSRQRSDWFDCTAWSASMRRKVATWRAGDTVEVEGALRRRYSKTGGGLSTVDLEVLGAARIARAAPAPSAPGEAVKDSAGAA